MIWHEELIGKEVCVVHKKTGLEQTGLIVDETNNTLTLGDVRIFKKQHLITFKDQVIDGAKLIMRSQDRVKARFKKNKVYSL